MTPRACNARLTVRQYQNAVADLLGTFRESKEIGAERGAADYYNARNFRNDKKVFDRVDQRVEFNFEDSSPDTNKIDAKNSPSDGKARSSPTRPATTSLPQDRERRAPLDQLSRWPRREAADRWLGQFRREARVRRRARFASRRSGLSAPRQLQIQRQDRLACPPVETAA